MSQFAKRSNKSRHEANQGSDSLVYGDLVRRIIGCAMRADSALNVIELRRNYHSDTILDEHAFLTIYVDF